MGVCIDRDLIGQFGYIELEFVLQLFILYDHLCKLFPGRLLVQSGLFDAHRLVDDWRDSDRTFNLMRFRGFWVPGGYGYANASDQHADPGHWRHVLTQ